jgi:hypothetical protein
VAIAALVLWISTVAIGTYLLATAARIGKTESAPAEPVSVSAGQTGTASADSAAAVSSPANGSQTAAAGAAAATPPAKPARVNKDSRFAPPSLQAERDEPLPGMKELAEFAHPALAIIGLAFWIGYVISRDRIMLEIGLGILLGAICAGLSWFAVNTRAAKRAMADGADDDSGTEDLRTAPLSFTPLVLVLHTVGAAVTLLFVALIVARV